MLVVALLVNSGRGCQGPHWAGVRLSCELSRPLRVGVQEALAIERHSGGLNRFKLAGPKHIHITKGYLWSGALNDIVTG